MRVSFSFSFSFLQCWMLRDDKNSICICTIFTSPIFYQQTLHTFYLGEEDEEDGDYTFGNSYSALVDHLKKDLQIEINTPIASVAFSNTDQGEWWSHLCVFLNLYALFVDFNCIDAFCTYYYTLYELTA